MALNSCLVTDCYMITSKFNIFGIKSLFGYWLLYNCLQAESKDSDQPAEASQCLYWMHMQSCRKYCAPVPLDNYSTPLLDTINVFVFFLNHDSRLQFTWFKRLKEVSSSSICNNMFDISFPALHMETDYSFSFTDAQTFCESIGGRITSYSEINAAWQIGYQLCK